LDHRVGAVGARYPVARAPTHRHRGVFEIALAPGLAHVAVDELDVFDMILNALAAVLAQLLGEIGQHLRRHIVAQRREIGFAPRALHGVEHRFERGLIRFGDVNLVEDRSRSRRIANRAWRRAPAPVPWSAREAHPGPHRRSWPVTTAATPCAVEKAAKQAITKINQAEPDDDRDESAAPAAAIAVTAIAHTPRREHHRAEPAAEQTTGEAAPEWMVAAITVGAVTPICAAIGWIVVRRRAAVDGRAAIVAVGPRSHAAHAGIAARGPAGARLGHVRREDQRGDGEAGAKQRHQKFSRKCHVNRSPRQPPVYPTHKSYRSHTEARAETSPA